MAGSLRRVAMTHLGRYVTCVRIGRIAIIFTQIICHGILPRLVYGQTVNEVVARKAAIGVPDSAFSAQCPQKAFSAFDPRAFDLEQSGIEDHHLTVPLA